MLVGFSMIVHGIMTAEAIDWELAKNPMPGYEIPLGGIIVFIGYNIYQRPAPPAPQKTVVYAGKGQPIQQA